MLPDSDLLRVRNEHSACADELGVDDSQINRSTRWAVMQTAKQTKPVNTKPGRQTPNDVDVSNSTIPDQERNLHKFARHKSLIEKRKAKCSTRWTRETSPLILAVTSRPTRRLFGIDGLAFGLERLSPAYLNRPRCNKHCKLLENVKMEKTTWIVHQRLLRDIISGIKWSSFTAVAVISQPCNSLCNLLVQAFYAQKGPFTKQIATEGFSTVSGQLISPL